MITAITALFGKFKYYIIAIFILLSLYFYMTSLKTTIELQKQTITKNEIDKQNIIDGYELTLKVEKETSVQKAITQEQKEVVVTKYKTLIKEVEKRGEIKQDEKSSFTIVTF
jgi:serine/threonine-protein kinase RIO1